MPARALLALAAVMLLAPAAAAGAAPATPVWRDAGAAAAPLAVDRSTVAYATAPGPSVVRRRASDGRVVGSTAAPAACTFTDAGAGALLWDCQSSASGPSGVVVDLASGRRTSLPAPPAQVAEAGRWTGVGREWLEASVEGYHYGVARYVRRATGEVREAETSPGRHVPDLDLPGLRRELCDPLSVREISDPSFFGLEPGPYAYRPPYGAARSQREEDDGDLPTTVLLDRCGGRTRTLSRCPAGCTDPELGAGTVAWVERSRARAVVRVHRIARRRTADLPLPGVEDVAVLGRRVYAVAGGRLKTLTLPR